MTVVMGVTELLVAAIAVMLAIMAKRLRVRPVLVWMIGLFALSAAANGAVELLTVGRLWHLLAAAFNLVSGLVTAVVMARLLRKQRGARPADLCSRRPGR